MSVTGTAPARRQAWALRNLAPEGLGVAGGEGGGELAFRRYDGEGQIESRGELGRAVLPQPSGATLRFTGQGQRPTENPVVPSVRETALASEVWRHADHERAGPIVAPAREGEAASGESQE
jgi:hypothetical protein